MPAAYPPQQLWSLKMSPDMVRGPLGGKVATYIPPRTYRGAFLITLTFQSLVQMSFFIFYFFYLLLLFFFLSLLFLWAAPTVYGDSQARG